MTQKDFEACLLMMKYTYQGGYDYKNPTVMRSEETNTLVFIYAKNEPKLTIVINQHDRFYDFSLALDYISLIKGQPNAKQ